MTDTIRIILRFRKEANRRENVERDTDMMDSALGDIIDIHSITYTRLIVRD